MGLEPLSLAREEAQSQREKTGYCVCLCACVHVWGQRGGKDGGVWSNLPLMAVHI